MSSSDLTNRRAQLSDAKRALLEKRLRGDAPQDRAAQVVRRRDATMTSHPPLSFAQQRLWFLDQLEPDNFAYNIPLALRLEGELDVRALEQSFNEIVRRHESLRTGFDMVEGRPAQIIAPALEVTLPVVNLAGLVSLSAAERDAEARRLAMAEAQRPFDLRRAPLLRACLLRLDREAHVLLITMHHIVSDAWSMRVLVRELTALYKAKVAGERSPLVELPVQYADFSEWQRGWMAGDVLDTQLGYWKRRLGDHPPALELPTDRPRPPVQSFEGASQPFDVSPEVSEALKELGRGEGATLFMTLLASFKVLLYRLTGQSDIVVGAPIANRRYAELEDLIGFFVNTLVLRTDLGGNPTFRELLGRVREATFGAYAHQDVPFEKLVEELQPERDRSRNPLFQVVFNLHNVPAHDAALPGLTVRPQQFDTHTTRFDLELHLWDSPEGIRGDLVYSTSLFDDSTIVRLLESWRVLLDEIIAAPDARVSDYELLPETERRKLLVEWNDTRRDYPRESSVHQLFEAHARATPERVALVFDDQQMTYGELNRRANQLARHLRARGVGAETRVGLLVERSFEMVVGLLGILKAGGAYVPLDPAYPHERLAFMLRDTATPLVLTTHGSGAGFDTSGFDFVRLDADWPVIAREGADNLDTKTSADRLAYVTYTSGSTGKPKGVAVVHRAVVRLVKQDAYASFDANEIFLQFAPLAFDASTFEIWGSLLNGAQLVLMPPGRVSLAELGGALRRHRVTTLWLTAGLFHLMVDEQLADLAGLRQLLAGGDVLSVAHVGKFLAAAGGCTLVNGYGPTENTTFTCCRVMHAPLRAGASVPIGRPVANTEVYILDEQLRPVPVGATGELFAGGDGLARGYFNRPGLTAVKFIPHPFSDEAGARLYRTGDLARYRTNGEIEFLGRVDRQVKVRGYRIELGEIEAALRRHAAVHEAAVVLHEVAPDDKRLVAFAVAADAMSPVGADELHGFLKRLLPEHMLPSAIVMLDEMPLTPSGKIDRHSLLAITGNSLPAFESSRAVSDNSDAGARTPVEELVAGIWCKVLRVENIRLEEDFFDLGGHSLLLTQLASRLRESFGVELPLANLFESPTIAGHAALVEQARRARTVAQAPPLARVSREGRLPLSFSQQRLWFLHELESSAAAYNIPTAVRLKGNLDVAALERTLDEIVRRHESLRTNFRTVEGQPVQIVHTERELVLPVHDLSGLESDAREAEMQRLAAAEARQSFDLARDMLLRVVLIRMGADDYVLAVTMHHIISDGWSMGVLIREVGILYGAFAAGEPSPLAKLPLHYADFAHWQREWLTGEVFETHLDYWRRQLDGELPALNLPTDRPRPAVQSFRGASQSVHLPADLSRSLRSLCRREGVTLFMLMLAAFKVLLHRYTGQTDIVVGSPIANRNRVELEGLIGFFVNTLVLRTNLDGDPTFDELLGRVRKVALEAYAHQDMPFEQLVEQLRPERSLSRNPLFQVMFQLENTPKQELPLAGLTLSEVEVERVATQFDLSLDVLETSDGLTLMAEYSTDLFDRATISDLLRRFVILLENAAANPKQHLSALPLLALDERERMLFEWNATSADYPRGRCLHELFAERVAAAPRALAASFDGEQLTYDELNRRANRLAHHLRARGVRPETTVAVMVDRSLEMVTTLLAVLKAGGAYVPLDPAYPQERLSFMLEDAGASLLLTQRHLADVLPEAVTPEVVFIDRGQSAFAQESDADPMAAATPDNLAYVIYTSGSTGQPKGVAVTHRALVNHCASITQRYDLRPDDRVLQFASVSFDVAAEELFPTLLGGAAVVLSGERVLESAELSRLITRERLSVLNLPAPLWQEWVRELARTQTSLPACLRLVVAGSEKVSLDAFGEWSKLAHGGARLMNAYGTSETTITSLVYEATGNADEQGTGTSLPIGRPLANTRVYALDSQMQPVPTGTPGELYIGGDGLARGYHRRAALTGERFIPDPFGDEAGGRLYRTGDLVRFLPDGNVEFLGRLDQQVKLRGYRIEPGEIEATLSRHKSVREAAVVVREDTPGDKRLVAYIVPDDFEQRAARQSPAPELEAEQLAQWQMVHDDEVFNASTAGHDPTLNISGWNSSYTGLPIPSEEMREWVDDAVAHVLARQPARVLEIGCGTGMLLFRIAPHCAAYTGTDFSRAALGFVRRQLEQRAESEALTQVELLEQSADDFKGIAPGSFDAVVLNSVVQYFPTVEYLLRVLEGAVKAVRPGGFIFVGDVRSLPLLEAFHTSVELHKAEPTLGVEQFRARVLKRLKHEEELVLDPKFFIALRNLLPMVSRVEVVPKRGRWRNEMTLFRYQVVLHVGEKNQLETFEPARLDWDAEALNLPAVRRMLKENMPEHLAISGIPNARLARESRALEMLATQKRPGTVQELLAELTRGGDSGVDPEEFWRLGDELEYDVKLDWGRHGHDGRFDVLFRRAASLTPTMKSYDVAPASEAIDAGALRKFANDPLAAKQSLWLLPQLKTFAKKSLPEHMIPSLFVVLDELPRTPGGKVDRRALPAPDNARTEAQGKFIAPRTPAEQTVAALWTDLLGVSPVGADDNFFDLGGHSLLATQLVSRVREAFQVEIALRQLFEHPTVAGLAALIETVQASGEKNRPPTITPVSRQARQMKRPLQSKTRT